MTALDGTMHWEGRHTWYRVLGGLEGGRTPVVLLHGGPGLTHDYLTPLAEALSGPAGGGRPCVLYDQYGGGRSGHRADAPAGFWTVELFLEELRLLLAHLGIEDAFHLLGHSWGGMLGLELAVTRPRGLRSLTTTGAFAASRTYISEVRGLVDALPEPTRAVILRHEAAGTTDSAAYQEAMLEFYRRHVILARPVPECLLRTVAAMREDPTVCRAMMGESEFSMTGSLRTWDIRDRLHLVQTPVLVASGRHDEVTPAAADELYEALPYAERAVLEGSSHHPHLDQPAEFLDLVRKFIDHADQ
ncbi:proline iminopeptidase-family hydrolase [Streptomyces actinomycinicus]|uniref:Proline iminopeptidase n=1 Tax=Streptomyces actinomycinicus TaxID=1695166 RepID=A0A937EIC0_9ACTN|nr:proline iminopeptidase-family hydrolase [Streptomyces actinomycinicus]MBL1082696.1 proline iminopeptidase-family hydrolase [Streptomyces actinomycinicus]